MLRSTALFAESAAKEFFGKKGKSSILSFSFLSSKPSPTPIPEKVHDLFDDSSTSKPLMVVSSNNNRKALKLIYRSMLSVGNLSQNLSSLIQLPLFHPKNRNSFLKSQFTPLCRVPNNNGNSFMPWMLPSLKTFGVREFHTTSSSHSAIDGDGGLLGMVRKGFEKAKLARDKDIVICVGNTGSGKSTAIAYCMGAPMEIITNNNGSDVARVIPNGESYPEIGEGVESKTLYPEIWKTGENIFFCDCPGFFDNRGPNQRIAISVNMELIIKSANSVKVVVFISEQEISNRAGGFLAVTELLSNLFLNPAESARSVLWVVTKASSKVQPIHIINKIYTEHGVLSFLKTRLEEATREAQGLFSEDPATRLHAALSSAFVKVKEINQKVESFQKQHAIASSITAANLYLLNIQKPESRDEIMRILQSINRIPKSSFCFDTYDDSRRRFSEVAEGVADEAIRLFQSESELRKEKEEYENKLKAVDKKIEEAKKRFSEEESRQMKKNWEQSYQDQIDALKSKQNEDDTRIKALKKQTEDLDKTDEEKIPIYDVHYTKSASIYKWHHQNFSYQSGVPFLRVQELYKEHSGYFSERTVEKETGVYKATYTTYLGAMADIRISIFTQKKLFPANQRTIKYNQDEIVRLNEVQNQTRTELAELTRKKQELSERQSGVELNAIMLDTFATDKKNLSALVKEKNKNFSEVSKKIETKKPLFLAIHEILSVVSSVGSQSILIQKFNQVYKDFFKEKTAMNLDSVSKTVDVVHSNESVHNSFSSPVVVFSKEGVLGNQNKLPQSSAKEENEFKSSGVKP